MVLFLSPFGWRGIGLDGWFWVGVGFFSCFGAGIFRQRDAALASGFGVGWLFWLLCAGRFWRPCAVFVDSCIGNGRDMLAALLWRVLMVVAWAGWLGLWLLAWVADGFAADGLVWVGLCWLWVWLGLGFGFGLVVRGWGLGWVLDEPESLILAQSERWRHA